MDITSYTDPQLAELMRLRRRARRKQAQKQMKLYRLEQRGGSKYRWGAADYHRAFVVRAPDAKTARKVAAESAGRWTAEAWTDPKHTTCRQVQQEGPAEVICENYYGT